MNLKEFLLTGEIEVLFELLPLMTGTASLLPRPRHRQAIRGNLTETRTTGTLQVDSGLQAGTLPALMILSRTSESLLSMPAGSEERVQTNRRGRGVATLSIRHRREDNVLLHGGMIIVPGGPVEDIPIRIQFPEQ